MEPHKFGGTRLPDKPSLGEQSGTVVTLNDTAKWIDIIPPEEWTPAVQALRMFFLGQNFLEVPTQHLMRPHLGNLAACENPGSIVSVPFLGKNRALPQTGQMWLEDFLLRNPDKYRGIFCVSYSYRNEQHPQKGRHNLVFPMFEFEMHGTHEELRALLSRLIVFLGIAATDKVHHADYEETALRYGVNEIEDPQERRLQKEFGHAVLLSMFPEHTSPFWNMRRTADKAEKTDCLLYGIETIGSAERSGDPADMWNRFHSISGGAYAAKLFELFGEKEILTELRYFLDAESYPQGHVVRSGGGIGMTRMIRALKLAGKI